MPLSSLLAWYCMILLNMFIILNLIKKGNDNTQILQYFYMSLWPVQAWLEVQLSKAVFFLTLYDSINDMKYFQNSLHHTSAVPQPFLLLMAVNLALAIF